MNIRSVIYKSNVNMNSVGDPRVMTIGYMKDSPVVLDVGCACGDLGVALKEHRNATMFGLEYNQGSIDIALETGAYEEIHQFNLDEITENSFPQYKGKFDYIVCGDVLEHLRDPMRSLNILKSYLKDDGKVIASIPNVAHMSIKSNLLVNDFTYTPLGLLDETHIHLFTHKSIALGLSSIGLKVDACKFTLQRKVAWQPNDPYPQLSDDMKDYLFKDWHSYVCQYVMSISCSEQNGEELFNHNIKKLNIDENNAPENIKNYRTQILAELTNTTAKKLDDSLLVLKSVEGKVDLSGGVCSEVKKSVEEVIQKQKDNGELLIGFKDEVLGVRNAQVGNIEVIKGRFEDLEKQSKEVRDKVVALSETLGDVRENVENKNSVLQENVSKLKDELVSRIESGLFGNKEFIQKEFERYCFEIKRLESEFKTFNAGVLGEFSEIKKALSGLDAKFIKEKDFNAKEMALLNKIERLKERRRYYKKLLFAVCLVVIFVAVYLKF